MTPNAIEILLHCHTTATPHPRENYPAVKEELRSLLHNCLIEKDGATGLYRTTSRGRAHVAQLCGLAWPVERRVWVGPDDKIIDFGG